MSEAVRDHQPQYRRRSEDIGSYRRNILYRNPVEMRRFQAFMEALAIPIGQEIAERVDYGASSHVLDVAGQDRSAFTRDPAPTPASARHGHGPTQCARLAEEPHPAARTGRPGSGGSWGPAHRALAPRRRHDYPELDLHDWSDPAARRRLFNCYQALPSGGRLLISEIVLKDDDPPSPFQAVMKLQMLLACAPGARERTESEYRGLVTDAGFADVEVVRLEGLRDLIVARKP